MKTAIALLLAFLALAVVTSVPVAGQNDHTYISNQAQVGITASIVYLFWGQSGFQNRNIEPQNYDSDVYMQYNCDQGSMHGTINPVEIDLIIEGSAPNSGGSVYMGCDISIVAVPSAAGVGVDIYQSVYGDINTPTGSVLNTIRP